MILSIASFIVSFIIYLITRNGLLSIMASSRYYKSYEMMYKQKLKPSLLKITIIPMFIMLVVWLIFCCGIISFINCMTISLSISSIIFYLMVKMLEKS